MKECKHPPERYYCWVAYDGTLVIVCLECQTILKGAYEQKASDRLLKTALAGLKK